MANRTFLQDFIEKNPKAMLNEDGTPRACAEHLGYVVMDNPTDCLGKSCAECWRQELK